LVYLKPVTKNGKSDKSSKNCCIAFEFKIIPTGPSIGAVVGGMEALPEGSDIIGLPDEQNIYK